MAINEIVERIHKIMINEEEWKINYLTCPEKTGVFYYAMPQLKRITIFNATCQYEIDNMILTAYLRIHKGGKI